MESTAEPNAAVQGSTNKSTIKPYQSATRRSNYRSNRTTVNKRRRARIKNAISELKSILAEAMPPGTKSRLEHAAILELTLGHLKTLHQNQTQSVVPHTSPDSAAGFRAGFANCAEEVGRFLSSSNSEGIDPETSSRLLRHLNRPVFSGIPGIGNDIRCLHRSLQPPTSAINSSSNTHTHPDAPVSTSFLPCRVSSNEIGYVDLGFNTSSVKAPVSSYHPGKTTPSFTATVQMHHQPCMLSPDVPLDLTSSLCSSSTSMSTLSSVYSIYGDSFHESYQGVNQYMYGSPGHGQPLVLVTPKRDNPDVSCWRPWCSSVATV